MLSRSVSFMWQLVRNSVLFISQIFRVPKWLWLNCGGSATGSRRVRDTRDDFATILRGIFSHKIFEHVQNFRDYLAPLGDICEEIKNHWRLFQNCFATHSRCLLPVVAKQSQSSEIGALLLNRLLYILSPYLTGLRLFCDSWRQTSRVGRKAVSKQSPVIRNILAYVSKWRKVVTKILNMFKNFMRQNSSQNGRKVIAGILKPSRTCRQPLAI